ncbi:MAG TPA: hypothetical protein PKJ52_10050, partial [Rectinema sp.]|nr:hypothetical protein [Rectinema sp.]
MNRELGTRMRANNRGAIPQGGNTMKKSVMICIVMLALIAVVIPAGAQTKLKVWFAVSGDSG